MNVLLTGALGNLGVLVLEQLLQQGHQVNAFDIATPLNRKLAKAFEHRANIIWGDICDLSAVEAAVDNQDAIIHLAAIIAPFSELKPELAEKVNVQGTKNLLEAATKSEKKPLFVFSSSISVFGNTQQLEPPRRSSDPLEGTDHYSRHKIRCEEMIIDYSCKKDLDWVIMRIGAMTDSRMRHSDIEQLKLALSIAADNRVEYIHPADAATAFVNALTQQQAHGKVLLLGGGKSCQITHSQLVNAMTSATGLYFPDSCFAGGVLYTDWLDTEESQRLLNFQNHSYQDLLDETFQRFRYLRYLVRPISPLIRFLLLRLARR